MVHSPGEATNPNNQSRSPNLGSSFVLVAPLLDISSILWLRRSARKVPQSQFSLVLRGIAAVR